MKLRNPFEPPSHALDSSYGLATRMLVLTLGLLVLSTASVAFMAQAYLVLPLVFAVTLPWTAGFRFVTCAICTVFAYLLGYVGIEVGLELSELGPAITEQTSGLYSRMLVTTGLLFSFAGVLCILSLRTLLNVLLKMHLAPESRALTRLIHA